MSNAVLGSWKGEFRPKRGTSKKKKKELEYRRCFHCGKLMKSSSVIDPETSKEYCSIKCMSRAKGE